MNCSLLNFTGEIRYEQFIQFLESDDQEEQGHAAFQVLSHAAIISSDVMLHKMLAIFKGQILG